MTRERLSAAVRVLLTGTVAAGLVYAGSATSATLRVGTPPAAGAGSSAAVTAYGVLCPGTELDGDTGAAPIRTSATVSAASAPTAALGDLRLPAGAGLLAISPGSDGRAASASGSSAPAAGAKSTTERGELVTARVTGPDPVLVSATGPLAPGVVAAQETRAAGKLAWGLLGRTCLPAAAETWLTAGAGTAGRQERLILVNPGDNPVDVQVDVLGAHGPVETGAAGRLSVPARGRSAILLDALAPAEPAPAVHVQASGGFVAATLADQWVDGITPHGLETTGPLAAPAPTQVLPGIRGGLATTVRVVNPGDAQAVVSVRTLTGDGPRALPGGRGVLRVAAGSTGELRLDRGLAEGTWALEVTSDIPVTAAAFTVPRKDPTDFAWSAAGEAITGLAGTAYPKAPADLTRTLSLAATGGAVQVQVVTLPASGQSQQAEPQSRTVDLAADSSTTIDLSATRAVWVRPLSEAGQRDSGQLRGAVLTSRAEGAQFVLSTLGLAPARLTTTSVAVHPAGNG